MNRTVNNWRLYRSIWLFEKWCWIYWKFKQPKEEKNEHEYETRLWNHWIVSIHEIGLACVRAHAIDRVDHSYIAIKHSGCSHWPVKKKQLSFEKCTSFHFHFLLKSNRICSFSCHDNHFHSFHVFILLHFIHYDCLWALFFCFYFILHTWFHLNNFPTLKIKQLNPRL